MRGRPRPAASRERRGKRSKARETALKILYQMDVTKDSAEAGIRSFFKHHRIPAGTADFITRLIEGTSRHRGQIDEQLARHATNWSLERMAMVDRNVLRMAAFELLFENETPPKVVINEAVELAKRFGSADSSKFVNGVLDALHKARNPATEPTADQPALAPEDDG